MDLKVLAPAIMVENNVDTTGYTLFWFHRLMIFYGLLFVVVEGLALLDLGVSPYAGDVFHEVSPLSIPLNE